MYRFYFSPVVQIHTTTPVIIMAITQESQLISFQPQGRLDVDGGAVLKQEMDKFVPQSGDLWVIDLAAVDFIDSSGLGYLVQGVKAARQNGCRLVLCNVKSTVKLIFELTQLDTVFEIFATYEEVLTKVKGDNPAVAA